ncbi:unnamed protein product [Amoebophrya sp. A25]|nr:unnamed protein product [Amoebophrya sp. A25]|eukprot:GSA25T00018422001.1
MSSPSSRKVSLQQGQNDHKVAEDRTLGPVVAKTGTDRQRHYAPGPRTAFLHGGSNRTADEVTFSSTEKKQNSKPAVAPGGVSSANHLASRSIDPLGQVVQSIKSGTAAFIQSLAMQ